MKRLYSIRNTSTNFYLEDYELDYDRILGLSVFHSQMGAKIFSSSAEAQEVIDLMKNRLESNMIKNTLFSTRQFLLHCDTNLVAMEITALQRSIDNLKRINRC